VTKRIFSCRKPFFLSSGNFFFLQEKKISAKEKYSCGKEKVVLLLYHKKTFSWHQKIFL